MPSFRFGRKLWRLHVSYGMFLSSFNISYLKLYIFHEISFNILSCMLESLLVSRASRYLRLVVLIGFACDMFQHDSKRKPHHQRVVPQRAGGYGNVNQPLILFYSNENVLNYFDPNQVWVKRMPWT